MGETDDSEPHPRERDALVVPPPHTLAKAIKAARERLGLTQTALAELLNVHKMTISHWERGKTRPDREAIEDLAEVLRIVGGPAELEYGFAEVEYPLRAALDVRRPLPRVAQSHAVRVWQQEFRLELVKAGASDEQVDEAMDLMRAPQVFTFFVGGAPKEFSEADAIKGMEAIAAVIRDTLTRKYGLKFPDRST